MDSPTHLKFASLRQWGVPCLYIIRVLNLSLLMSRHHCNQLSLSFSKQALGVSNFQCCCPLKGNVNGRLFLKVSLNAIHMSNSDMADCKSFARQQNPENIDPSLLYVAYEPCDIAHKSAQFGRHRGSRTNTAAKKGLKLIRRLPRFSAKIANAFPAPSGVS